jgi:hypothetical protein
MNNRLRSPESIKEAIVMGIRDLSCATSYSSEDMADLIEPYVRDFLANKFVMLTASQDPQTAREAESLWRSLGFQGVKDV